MPILKEYWQSLLIAVLFSGNNHFISKGENMCGCGCRPGILGILGKAAWLLTVLAALNMGLAAAGIFDFWTTGFVIGNPQMAKILMYVIGACGAWGLFTFGMAATHCMSGKCSECK